jgi:hypothetical protein
VLLTRLMDNDPELSNVWEFIGQPWANRPVYYWSLPNGRRKLARYTGSGHDRWSHITVWRSQAKKVPTLWVPGGGAVVKPPTTKPVTLTPPAWPAGIAFFRASTSPKYNATVRAWQARMKQRGWAAIKVDGYFGPASAAILRRFQAEKNLAVDGLLGPASFRAAWTAKVT